MQTISGFIQGAGWGIWPTLAFAAVALGLSAVHAGKPRPHWMPLIVGTGLAMFFSGLLAFVTDCAACFETMIGAGAKAPIPDFKLIVMAGLTEAFANLEVALVAATLVAVLASLGTYRARAPVAAAS